MTNQEQFSAVVYLRLKELMDAIDEVKSGYFVNKDSTDDSLNRLFAARAEAKEIIDLVEEVIKNNE